MSTEINTHTNYRSGVVAQDMLFQPFLIDDWLHAELEQSGLLFLNQGTLFQQQQQQQQQQQPPSRSNKRLVPIMPKSSPIVPQLPLLSPQLESSLGGLMLNPTPGSLPSQPSPPCSVRSFSTTTAAGTMKRKTHDTADDGNETEPHAVLVKRQRNTDAARRSRLKKMHKMETLENRVGDLESENSQLNTRVAVLESEKQGLESKDKDLQERIRKLEQQLREAHKALGAKLTKD